MLFPGMSTNVPHVKSNANRQFRSSSPPRRNKSTSPALAAVDQRLLAPRKPRSSHHYTHSESIRTSMQQVWASLDDSNRWPSPSPKAEPHSISIRYPPFGSDICTQTCPSFLLFEHRCATDHEWHHGRPSLDPTNMALPFALGGETGGGYHNIMHVSCRGRLLLAQTSKRRKIKT
jgi:hypothetical protein